MDMNKIFDIMGKNNIDPDLIFSLVDEAKTLDLTDEDDIRKLIAKGTALAGRELDKDKEELIIQTIKKEGITSNLLNYL